RAYRIDSSAGGPVTNGVFDPRLRVHNLVETCKKIREGIGPDGDFSMPSTRSTLPISINCFAEASAQIRKSLLPSDPTTQREQPEHRTSHQHHTCGLGSVRRNFEEVRRRPGSPSPRVGS